MRELLEDVDMRQDIRDYDAALMQFRHTQASQKLEESAAWYAELYADDPDLQELTEVALEGWPS